MCDHALSSSFLFGTSVTQPLRHHQTRRRNDRIMPRQIQFCLRSFVTAAFRESTARISSARPGYSRSNTSPYPTTSCRPRHRTRRKLTHPARASHPRRWFRARQLKTSGSPTSWALRRKVYPALLLVRLLRVFRAANLPRWRKTSSRRSQGPSSLSHIAQPDPAKPCCPGEVNLNSDGAGSEL